MSKPALRAEIDALRAAVTKARMDMEMYARCCVLLAKAIEAGNVSMIEGHPAFKVSQFQAVPKAYTVEVNNAEGEPVSDDPNAEREKMLVVVVKSRGGSNGVAVPERPILQIPGMN